VILTAISIVGWFISKRDIYRKRMYRIAADMLKERLEMEDLHGSDWPGKPVILIVNQQFPILMICTLFRMT
jgi:hypothetical protein